VSPPRFAVFSAPRLWLDFVNQGILTHMATRRKRTTIKDIARESGVSLSTVSLVLNNHPRISEETRRRVREVVLRHGYEPNSQAQGLASKSSRVFAVVVPPLRHVFADIYFGEIISGVHDYTQEIGFKILLEVANERFLAEKEYLRLVQTRRADGLLWVASTIGDTHLLDFAETGHPFVLVNNFFPGHRLNHVMADYAESARLAAAHLTGLGHRRIGLVRGEFVQSADAFRSEFLRCCRDRGCRDSDLADVTADFSEEGGRRAALRLLAERPDLTAIMAGNDRMALGALRAAAELGITVPSALSVMGVDDIPSARFSTPALTTVRHDHYAIGRAAAQRLHALATGTISACAEIWPVDLVTRESTAPVPR
jgi:LacI family transcriptional regulator